MPGTGGPGLPDTPGGTPGGLWDPRNPWGEEPTTGKADAGPDPTDWTRWWRYNRDPYLQVGTVLAGREAASGGQTGRAGLTDQRIRAEIVPTLTAALQEGGDLKIIREGMMALARIGPGGRKKGGVGLDFYAKHFLGESYASLQEAAILALGVEGQPSSVPLLRSILDNTEEGRELTKSESVSVRLRAYAAFGLGLLGQGSPDEHLRLDVVHSLLDSLGNQRTATREIQVACVLAMGLVELPFCDDDPERLAQHKMEGDRHLCGGIQLKYLLDVFRNRELDPWVRAHAGPAIGRLARNSPAAFHEAAVQELAGALESRAKEPETVRQGCVIGLGLYADGDEDPDDVAARDALAKAMKKGDALSQRLAMIGLARAAARPGSGENDGDGLEDACGLLLKELSRGRKDKKAWAALALGALGYERMQAREVVGEDVGDALRLALKKMKDPKDAAALVLGIGILRDESAREAVLASFERIDDPAFRACAVLTLGLVDAQEGLDSVREAYLGAECDVADLMVDVAMGLRLLGDHEVTAGVLERMDCAETPEERAALVQFLGELDDPRGVSALLATVKDSDRDPLVRATAMNALGRMCDRRDLSWTATYAADLQYELLTWTLQSPFGDGTGILDWR